MPDPEDVSDLALPWLRGKSCQPNDLLFDRLASCRTARVREIAAGLKLALGRGRGVYRLMTKADKATLLDLLEEHLLRRPADT